MAAEFERVWLAYQSYLRSWGLAQTAAAWRNLNLDDIRATFPQVATQVGNVYAVATAGTLTATDEYMWLKSKSSGLEYTGSWSKGRPNAPLELPSGASFRSWMSGAQWRILSDIGQGMTPDQAAAKSFVRAANEVGTSVYQRPRETTFNRFLVDSLLGGGDPVPKELQPYAREVQQYEGLWDGRSSREYRSTWDRWRRVPSVGACDFCLMLATRSDYTSAEAAIYAGGGEGQVRKTTKDSGVKDVLHGAGVQRRRSTRMESGERFHRACRCTVAMTSAQDTLRVQLPAEEYERLSTRDENGNLPEFNGYTIEGIDWIDDSPGMVMPERAPWADAFRSAPRRKDVSDAEYLDYRRTAKS